MSKQEPPYLWEMLASQPNLYAFLGSLLGGVLLSIPFGFGVGAVPLIAFAAGEAIAAMYVPDLSIFRARVDQRYRSNAREAARRHLIDEIERRTERRDDTHGSMAAYERMRERVASLYRVAEDSRTQISVRDVERLDDATLDYLSIWLGALVIADRSESIGLEDIEQRIEAVDRELQDAKPGTDIRTLKKARHGYADMLVRHRRMLSHKHAIDAALLSMPDQMEEIYQTIMTAPTSREMGSKLEQAISRLRLEEDIELELARELKDVMPDFAAHIERQSDRPSPQAARAEAKSL